MTDLGRVSVEMAFDRFDRDWPGAWYITGADASGGLWKHKHLWRIWCMLGSMVREWREHCVYADDQEQAIARLMRALRAEEDWWSVRRIVIYKIQPPLTAAEVRRVEDLNAELSRMKCEPRG